MCLCVCIRCVRMCLRVHIGMRARRGSKWILILTYCRQVPQSNRLNGVLSSMHVHSLCFGLAQT